MPEIPVTNTFRYELKELHRKHQKKLITDEEFSRRRDELNTEEAKLHEPLGPTLIKEELGDIDKELEDEIKEEIKVEQAKIEAAERAEQAERNRRFQKERQEKINEEYKLRQERLARERDRANYRSEINDYISHLRHDTQNWQKGYFTLQIILLVFSAITAAMAGIDGVPRWIVTITGVVATIAGGLFTTFKVQDRIYAFRKAEAEVGLECQKYDYRTDEYKDIKGEEERFIQFSRKINSIRGQQMLQEVELWNPKKEEQKEEEKATQDKAQEEQEEKEASKEAGKKAQGEKPDEVSEGQTQDEKSGGVSEL